MAAKILIIDDERDVHESVKLALNGYPVEVHSAFDGRSGIAAAERLRPDVIVLDVGLPGGLDGLEVCELLSVRPETAGVPVLMVSGANSPADRVRALGQGAVDFIGKPFAPEELSARVRANLRYRLRLAVESRRAVSDPLTGLWNRSYFEDRLRSSLALGARQSLPLSCIFADVDHFKRVNDEHGHAAGDGVLCAVAEVMARTVRVEDVVCRYGGEEFAVLCIATASAGALAERLRVAVEGLRVPRDADGKSPMEVRVTCSFGVATTAPGGATPGALLAAADEALYAAKRGGRNRVCERALGAGERAGISGR